MRNILRELYLTFSNQKSLLCSKKIERSIVFITMMIITLVYFSFHVQSMESLSFIEILATWLGYGGYNTWQTHKDKKLELANGKEELSEN